LRPQVESALYRVVQEALTNATQHGDAKRVKIHLHALNGGAELTVRDDGTGFDPADPADGFGLRGMMERIELVQGRFEVSSEPGAGTTIRATVP
jgi:signal transduction histidine kinase